MMAATLSQPPTAGAESSSGDSDRSDKEKVSLLPRATNPLALNEGARTLYGSDGEVETVSPHRTASSSSAVSETELVHSPSNCWIPLVAGAL